MVFPIDNLGPVLCPVDPIGGQFRIVSRVLGDRSATPAVVAIVYLRKNESAEF